MTLGRYAALALTAVLLVADDAVAQGPTGTVAGRVVEQTTEQPIVGAQVSVGDLGALTDEAGRFTIQNVPVGTQTLRATHIGFGEATRQVVVRSGQSTVMLLSMSEQATELAELVVIGYGEQEASDITGVIEQVNPEEFNTGRVVSPEELISGKVAGVQILDSGEPGGGIQIRIRGGTSIRASSEPLYVVDGMPLPMPTVGGSSGGITMGRNPLSFINPNDIESITVLKDAASTAIYGSRGSNGVVLIETRGGSGVGAGVNELSYNGNVSSSVIDREPDILSADQFREVFEGWGPPGDDVALGSANTNWFDEITRSGVGHDHSIAFSGASGDISYRLSLGYLNQEGVIRGTEVERLNLGVNYAQNFFENNVRVTTNLKGSHINDEFTPGGVIGGAVAFAPTQPVRDDTSSFGGFWEWQEAIALNNPIAELELVTDQATTLRSTGDIEAEVDMPYVDGLTGTVRLGYDITDSERETFRPTFLRGEAEGATPGYLFRRGGTQTNRLLDAFLYYGFRMENLGADFDVTGGYSYEDTHAEFPEFEAQGLAFDYLGTDGVPAAEEMRERIFVEDHRLIAFFGRANVNLLDRYLLTAAVRRDGSSRFGPDNQWGWFPSVGAAWRISEESFMEGVDFFSDLKLRTSWGINGNQSFGNYLWAVSYDISDPTAQYQFGERYVTLLRPSAVDEDIKWEETSSWNLGLDFGVLDNRLTGALEYYTKETNDLLFEVPPAAGVLPGDRVTTNIGRMENQGFELSLDAAVFQAESGGFWWNASFNAARNTNEVLAINPLGIDAEGAIIRVGDISGGVGNTIQVITPGTEAYSFYVYRHRRESDGTPIWADVDQNGSISPEEALLMYVDQPTVPCPTDEDELCPDGIINQDDRVPFEQPAPKWIIGHTSLMGFGSFDLGFTMRAHIGNHVYNNVASNNGHFRALSYVGAPNNLHASVLETGFMEEQYFSDYYVEDASFLRMDNITLGYTLPQLASGQSVRVFGTVQNVFTLTEYRGIDPLGSNNGIDNNVYPRSRTFTAGANVQF